MVTTDYTDNPEWNAPPHKEVVTFRFKHYRDENHKLFATTCSFINQDNIVVAIGVALCSSQDNFNRKIGRSISFGRCMKAYVSKRGHFPIRKRDCSVVNKCIEYMGYKYKAHYYGSISGYKFSATPLYKENSVPPTEPLEKE